MVNRIVQLSCVFAAALLLCSCSKSVDYGKETHPVTGSVFVDGQPAALLTVTLHDVKGFDSENPSVSTAMTKEDGTFAVSTFEAEDGVPVGEYTATFQWGKLNPIKNAFEGDQLKGRYMDPRKSEVKVTVSEGEPTDMGRIDLKTK
jgi:hypothetical protein